MTSFDRRRAVRVPVSMRIGEDPQAGALGFGYVRNISAEGLAIGLEAVEHAEEAPAIGAEMHLRFKLPESELVLSVSGRIVRREIAGPQSYIAIEFVGLAPDFREEILRYVSKYHR